MSTTAFLPLLSRTGAGLPQWATITYPQTATSGGVAYFDSPTSMVSSALLAHNGFVLGGGAGGAPFTQAITGLVLGNGASAPAAYGGTACVNQFIRSLDGVGAATCAPVANADLTNSSMTLGSTAVSLGGTLAAATARGPNGFNVESLHKTGDADVAIAATTRTEQTTTTFTAPRTWTLPAASSLNPGQSLIVSDAVGAINGANTLTVAAAGSDTINGGASQNYAIARTQITFVSDGVSKWTFNGAAGGGTVTSVTITAGTGIAASGTCSSSTLVNCALSVSLPVYSNALVGDVALNNTSTFFTGPSVSQGSSGTWACTGTVTMIDVAANNNYNLRMTDGAFNATTALVGQSAQNAPVTVTMTGVFVAPAGNIRIQVRANAATTAAIKYNLSGESRDAVLFCHRIG